MNKIFIGLDFGIRNISLSYILHGNELIHKIIEIRINQNDKINQPLELIRKEFQKIFIANDEIYLNFENIETFETGDANKFKIPTIRLFQSILSFCEELTKNKVFKLHYQTFNSSVIKMLQKKQYFKRLFNEIKKTNSLKTMTSHAKDSVILCYLAWTKFHATLFDYQRKVF